MNTKTIDQVFVPSTLGDTTGSMDASIISSLDDAWARRVKIDDTSKALSVVYGKAWVEPVRVFAASRQWSKREKWYHRSTHKYSTLVSMFAFATAGTSRSYAVRDIVFDELRGFNDIANEFRGDKYGRKKFNYNVGTGRQTAVPEYVSAACAPGARFGVPVPWDAGAIGQNVGYLEFEAVYTGWDLFKDESYPNIDKLLIEDVSQSNNPADCIYDYLIDTFYGAGFDPALLDASSFQAVRDYFDTQITSSNYTGPYLEFNVALSTGDEFKDNLNKMLSQSRCALVDRDGRIALVVEREINPVFELDSSNIVGAINLQLPEASNKYNRIVARYKPDSFSGEEAIFVYPRLPEDRDLWEAWYAEDGRISQTEVTFDCISNKDQIAQQLEIFAKRSRFGRMLECEVMGQATLLEVFDVVQVTHDYYNLNKHEFMVESRKPDDKKGTVKLKLRAYDSAIYPFDTNRTVEDESYSRVPGAIVCTITDVQYIVHPDLSATVSWEYEANADVSFEVYVDSDAEETSFTGTTGSNQIVVTGLEKGTYELVITGVANGRNAAGSHTSTISIYEPDSPITPIPKVTHNSIELSASLSHGWSVDESLQFYISETAQQPANPFARGVNAVATDLKPSTKYYYWITAVNRAGESAAVSDDVTTLRAPNLDDLGGAPADHTHPYVPLTRKINGYPLSDDISLTSLDVGAAPAFHTHADYIKNDSAVVFTNNIGFTRLVNFTAGIHLTGTAITGVNKLSFETAGPNKGVSWPNWSIYESPDNLTTDAQGNLQFVNGGIRRMTLKNDGEVDIPGTLVSYRLYEGGNRAYSAANRPPYFTNVTSSSNDLYATAGAVKIAYDKAVEALNSAAGVPSTGGTFTGPLIVNNVSFSVGANLKFGNSYIQNLIELNQSDVAFIGYLDSVTYGDLNGYATTFTCRNDIDSGWLWRGYADAFKTDGAMALTEDGRLTVKKSIKVGGYAVYHRGDKPTAAEIGAASSSHSHSGYVSTSRTINAGTGLSGGGSLSSNRTINLKSAASSELGGLKARISGTTLYLRNDGGNA
ncbi:hypothetical protein [Paraferrimonas haliotis]|uniref:hypothetical protein n=1 Tax=Paraferrimonas haliotis TaxID=2013866 RepID=UPI000BA96B88|nr:hypothetical protein [Paraferrimonas haliotis]